MRIILYIVEIVFLVQAANTQSSSIDYFGQTPPDSIPKLFMPEAINHLAHSSPTFSTDGSEMYWSTVSGENDTRKIYFVRYENGIWSEPILAPFSGNYHDDQPFISYDGNKLFFASKRPKTPGGDENLNLWYCIKSDKEWSDPIPVNNSIGTWTPSVTRNGTLYFMDNIEDAGNRGYKYSKGIFRSVLVDGKYSYPELLPEQINSKDFQDWCPFIAPDESYLIFSSDRSDGFGMGDLYISFHDVNSDTWSEPVNLGEPINTQLQERFPGVSPDGKYLFFTRWLGYSFYHDLYWVSVKIIDDLKKENEN